MMAAGLVEEVERLLNSEIDPNLPSMQGLGYKEIAGFLNGDYGREGAIDLLKKNTRRFAKRQFTWFRADSRVIWINVSGRTVEEVSNIIKESLSNE
jgi:tRNA dimethylallyltransferase